ncbi:MAG: hypothetical protein RL662_773 [Bacteroidota bacterium]|jgi:hypothetical protein
MKLVWKLLRENISKPQLIGFFFANFIGMTIVLLAIQFYMDTNPLFSDKDSLFKKDYLTITKKVGVLSSLYSTSSHFTDAEISNLRMQSFVENVGQFTPSQYKVFAGINNQGAGIAFNTQMFFESVSDQFIDTKSGEWYFSPSDANIPIILPKNYLDLYNFGFAEANALPKISEGLIGIITLDISIVGKDNQLKELKGRIVGFSNRINTILVPETFMTWANSNFGGQTSSNASRLIVEINNIGDPSLSNYLKDKGYEISGDNATASKMSFFLTILVTIVIVIGIIISILSFFILTLSIYLLLEKNMNKLDTLRLIGYSKSYVIRPYEILSVSLNGLVMLLSIALVVVLRYQYLEAISKIYPSGEVSFPVYCILVGMGIFVAISILNMAIIRKKVH